MDTNYQKLTLDMRVTYRILVPGELDKNWIDWNGGMMITYESDNNGNTITCLNLKIDQAGLQGLLQHLYSLGLPLISVVCEDCVRNFS